MMSENTQTGAMNYDNLALKCWLYCIGPVRRCEELKKLKADLQNLGLSRRQVHQGLIQLATKPHVVLTRQIPYRRYRFKNLSEDERGKNIIDNLRTKALNLRPRIEDIHKSNTTERFIKKENKYIKKADGVTAYENALISSNQELFVPNICYKLKNPLATMHSFDETLKQLDECISSKMIVNEKSTNIKKLENNIVSSKKCNKDENHHCICEHKNTQKIQEVPNLISDKVSSKRILMFNKYKKKRIEPKLKLNSCFAKKVRNDSIKSDDYKKVDTKNVKSDIGKKLHNDKKIIDINDNSMPDKNTYSKHEDSTLNCSHNTEEVTKVMENTHKRKLRKLIVSDKNKEIIKKKRKIKDRFRTYFGDCISVSEDEQEQNIIEERFRKTRKRDSVDSCESGVYVAERNITMTAAHVDIIQKSNEDTSQGIIANVDINHKPNDDISQRTIANLDIIHKLNKNTSQETIVNVDTNYGLNEDTSQRTIVNVDVIHKSNEDTSQGIIANVDKSHKSNEGTSQGTIANIIQKSDEDTSRRIIANVDVIHESNEDTSQGIIANVDTSHKSNEDTSQSTIANIIQESDKDTSQGNIVNVDTIHESNEVADNTNNKTTNQIGGATNFVEIECNKLQNNTHENKTHNTEIEKKELSRNKEFINFSEKNNIEKSKHASSVTDIFQITEQSKVNVSTAKIKATTEINNILPSDIPEICIPSHDTVAISKNLSGSEKSNLDTTDLNDLLHMRSFKTCQIRSNGNVLSIQEIDMNADVGENSHLKKLSEIQINCNHSITERVLNYNEKDKEVQLSSNTNKTDNVISTNNISNVKNNENELAVKNSELSILEKKDIQSNKLPQGKLRVLSSAELGARWCPTPVNSVTSTVQFSHENTETQTVPETTVSIPAPVSETASQTTIPKNMKKYTDSKFSKFVYVTLIKIRNLIQNIRISPNTNLNYDKLLNMEFQKLRKILNTDDFIDLIKGIVNILNKEMLVIPPLSLNELFLYAPSVKSYYVQILNKNKTIINSLSECRTVKSVGVPNQITLNQNRSGDAQASQNIRASSTQSRLQYLLSISSEQGQTLRPNIVPNQPQQNFQDQIVLPLQNNVLQSNVLVNPITMNNNSHNNNMHQHTYMQVHANFTQQKVSNVNFAKQNPATNMHVRQSYPLQYSLFLPTGRNQLGGVHTSIPVTNASSINQQYVSSVFIPQTNTYCNINVPSYTIQQNMNSTHISQGTQLQGVSQSVSPNHNIPQPVKTMVATNISHSAQQNMNSTHMSQGIQLQGVSQSVSPHHNIPQPVQQNMNSKHMLQGTQLQGISQSVSPHRNIPQPAQQNMNSTHMSQRTQLQGVSQSVSPNHNIPQPVQTMVATNISHSVQQNMNSTHMSQGTQLQGVSRSVSPHRNIPQPVQQNMSSKHMSQGTRLQGISQSVSPHRNIPQPAQQNMNSTHMSQGTQLQGVSQSVSPNHNIPQPVQTMVGTNISHSVQQNMSSKHMSQGTRLQGISQSVSPHRNIPQPAQQNMNSTHMSQGTQLQGVSQSVSPNHNIPQPVQTMVGTNISHSVQQNMNSTHMSQGTQLQGVSQSVSPNHNIPQPVQTMVGTNISHSVQQNMSSKHMSQGTRLQGISQSVSPHRNIPQPAQQNMNSTHMSQGTQLQGVSQSVSPNHNIPQPVQTMVGTNISHSVQQNMNSTHMSQGTQLQGVSQSVSPNHNIPQPVKTMVATNISHSAQQNMNSTHMSQGTQLQGVSQSVSPNHNIPQPVKTMVATNISHSVQQNMNSTHMSQGTQLQGVSRSVSPHCSIPQPVQQNMNSTHMSQGTQLQGVSQSVSPNHNIPQPVKTMVATNISHSAQQNMNSTHMSQGTQLQGVSQSVSPNHNIPQPVQTMVAMNISHSVQQNMNSTHMSQGSQLQGVLRSVSPHRNIQQYIQTMVATNISHSVPKNSQHIEQKHQKVVPQKRIPMEVPQNRISEQVASSQQLKKSTLRRLKKKENLQVSLESTTNLFDILKYISDIQKLILLKQLDYYFGCTTWLQQQFTSEKWQEIHSERSVLLHFQTLLKHLVEKTIKSLLPDNYQTNILKNIEIDVPKVIQITIKENNGICCEVEAAKSNQEQYNAMNIKQNCTNYKENSNVTITQNQCDKEHEATDNSQTNGSSIKQNLQSHQTSNVDVCQENKVEREPNSSRNIYNSNTKELNLDESTKITENIPQIGIEKSSALSNMKLLNKDTLQQLNPHLVIVEISSKNDQVTVVDTNANSENTPKSKESEEYQEHQYLKGTITDDLTVSSFKSPNNIEYFNNKESHNTSLERPPTTYIKDVRSISMEAYLRIGVTNNVPANTMEENIEEEEIKICLYCGKPSTVACIICLEAKYCSKECSQLHWGDHYKDCSPVERSISS